MPLNFSFPYVSTPSFYSGTPVSNLVPDVFPVGINGRPYMLDLASGQFTRQFEPRVRDSVDQSTAPGEAAINPGGLWRRGEVSWHLGAGQKYADTAEAVDYRFWKSKGVNPWTKGQLTLLNATKSSLPSSNTNLKMAVTDTRVYVLDGSDVKYTTDPFATTPTWTPITKGTGAGELPNATPIDIASDGTNVYITYPGLTNVYGLWKYTPAGVSSNVAYGHEFGHVDFVKGFFITSGNAAQGNGNDLYFSPTGNVGADDYEHPVSSFEWIASASGQNAIYIAGKNGDYGSVYKLTIKSDGTLDTPVLALELPREEYPTDIHGYLGFIILGTNKGVRFCTADNNSNLISGQLIQTTGAVKGFSSEDSFIWFGWSNYDSTSGGIGRLDLRSFTNPNTPAYATDLMYSSTADVLSVATFNKKRLFSISGVGVIAEDSANLVASGTIDTGIYRWGIADRKFVAFIDTRALPLLGSIASYYSLDGSDYSLAGTWDDSLTTENSFSGSDEHAIEASFRFALTRESATAGPTFTRWMARAYAAPFRSEIFTMPLLIHSVIRVFDKEYYFDVDNELEILRGLISRPQVVTLQVREETISVILEDMVFQAIDGKDKDWLWQGTATVTMRSVQE